MYAVITTGLDHDVTIVERSSCVEYLQAIVKRLDNTARIVPLSERTAALSRPVALFVSGLGMMGDMPTIEPTDAELAAIEQWDDGLVVVDDELWPWYRPGHVDECEEAELEYED